jgi:hypothetical protein
MRFLITTGVLLAGSSGLFSQHRAGLSPAASPVIRAGPLPAGHSVAPGWGASGIGAGSHGGGWKCTRFNRLNTGTVPYVPFLVPFPIYPSGGFYPDNPYPVEPQLQQPMGMMPPQQPPPPVIINQYLSDPGQAAVLPPSSPPVQVYDAPAAVRPEPLEPQRPSSYFIALKDGWVYTASEYWVEGGTLHYITVHGRHNQVSLNLVDRQTSARLNRGRDFQLPPS